MPGADVSDTFRRVCKVDERLINEELGTCLFVGLNLFENHTPRHQCARRIIGIAEELCHGSRLPVYGDASGTFDRNPIFSKGMRGDINRIARFQDSHTV